MLCPQCKTHTFYSLDSFCVSGVRESSESIKFAAVIFIKEEGSLPLVVVPIRPRQGVYMLQKNKRKLFSSTVILSSFLMKGISSISFMGDLLLSVKIIVCSEEKPPEYYFLPFVTGGCLCVRPRSSDLPGKDGGPPYTVG